MTRNPMERAVTLRQGTNLVAPVSIWMICAVFEVDVLVEGSLGQSVRTTLIVGAAAYAAWLFLFWPALRVDRDGVTVVNPLRTYVVPFGALEGVHLRGLVQVRFRSADSTRSVTSWNAPGIPRSTRSGPAPVEVAVERFQRQWEADPQRSYREARVAWNRVPLLALGFLVIPNIAIWFR